MKLLYEGELDLVWYGDAVDVVVGGQSVELTEELESYVGKEIRLEVEIAELPR